MYHRGSLGPILPITWFSVQMSNRHDENPCFINPIYEPIGKSFQEIAAVFAVVNGPKLRELLNTLQGLFDIIQKGIAKPRLSCFVVRGCGSHLLGSLCVKDYFMHRI